MTQISGDVILKPEDVHVEDLRRHVQMERNVCLATAVSINLDQYIIMVQYNRFKYTMALLFYMFLSFFDHYAFKYATLVESLVMEQLKALVRAPMKFAILMEVVQVSIMVITLNDKLPTVIPPKNMVI